MLLPYDPAVVWKQCRELDDWRARLDAKGPLPRAWIGRLRRDLEVEAVAASTSMEGVPVTVDHVRRILVGDRPPDVRMEDRALVEGYRNAMGYVLRRADDPSFAWDRELIVGLHDRVLASNYAAGAGRFRVGQQYLVNSASGEQVFLPPPPEQVPELVDEMCERLQSSAEHPTIATAWAHLAIAAIHPFSDGNGRVARVLAALAMYRGGFRRPEFTSLEEWWGGRLNEYYAAFACLGREFARSADVTPFIVTHAAAQLSQVRALDLREQVERRIWTVIVDLVTDLGLDQRVANAVFDAFFDREVTAGYYRSLVDVSPATATNDLSAAVASTLLRAEGRRRSRRYRAGPTLYQRVGEAIGVDASGPLEGARAAIVGALAARLTRLA